MHRMEMGGLTLTLTQHSFIGNEGDARGRGARERKGARKGKRCNGMLGTDRTRGEGRASHFSPPPPVFLSRELQKPAPGGWLIAIRQQKEERGREEGRGPRVVAKLCCALWGGGG